MTTGFARLARLAAAVVVAVGGALALPATTSQAQSVADSCVGAGKVWLVAVTDTGSGVGSLCVGTPSSGLGALSAVGYKTESSGLVCSVGGYPATCPTTYNGKYWSYWTASPGGSWSYLNGGPGNRRPPAGTLEGWCYTPQGSQSAQQSACRSMLTGRLNPASVVATKPATSAPPPTTKPTAQPSSTKPTTKPSSTKPTTKPSSTRPAGQPSGAKPTTSSTRPTSRASQSSSSTPSAKTSTAASPTQSSRSSSIGPSSASPSGPSSSGSAVASSPVAPTTPPGDDATPASGPQATVQSSGSPVGVLTTVGVLALGGVGAGLYFWKGRKS